MKAVLISGEFPPMVGGLGDYTACLAAALEGLGVRVSVLTSKAARPSEGVFPYPVLARVPGWSFSSWAVVRREVRRQAAEIVHIQYQPAAYGLHPAINLLPLFLRLRVPETRSVVTFHDLRVPYIFPKAGPLRPWTVKALARWSYGVICTDDADLQTVSRWGPKTAPHLIPIGSNIPVETGHEPVTAPGETGGRPVTAPGETGHRPVSTPKGVSRLGEGVTVGYFGLLNQSKGVETLMRACGLLLQRGLSLTLVMVGAALRDSDASNAAYARMVRALASELELERAMRWTGHLSSAETSLVLQKLHICVLPYLDGASFRRGTLMVALAHGLPIVTTTSGSWPASGPRLLDGVNCRLVPPGDEGALAQAIEELVSAPFLREKLAAGALELAGSFTWEAIARKTVGVYEQVLLGGQRS